MARIHATPFGDVPFTTQEENAEDAREQRYNAALAANAAKHGKTISEQRKDAGSEIDILNKI